LFLVQFLTSACPSSARAQQITPDEAERIWESIRRLTEILPPEPGIPTAATPVVRVRLLPSSTRVAHWEEQLRLAIEITGAQDLTTFFAFLEFGPGLAVPPEGFAIPGPLWLRFASAAPGEESPVGYGGDGYASILGVIPKGITGDGILAEIEFRVREPGSTTVRMTSFTWMKAGESRVMRRAEVLGSAQVEVVYQKPQAYLSFAPPSPESSLGESPSRVEQQVDIGTPFPVYVCVEGLAAVTGIAFSVDFQREGLELIGVREGEMVRSAGRALCCFDAAAAANALGGLRDQGIALLDPGAGLRGGGCLVELYFLAREGPPATIGLRTIESVDPGTQPRRRLIEVRSPGIPLTVSKVR